MRSYLVAIAAALLLAGSAGAQNDDLGARRCNDADTVVCSGETIPGEYLPGNCDPVGSEQEPCFDEVPEMVEAPWVRPIGSRAYVWIADLVSPPGSVEARIQVNYPPHKGLNGQIETYLVPTTEGELLKFTVRTRKGRPYKVQGFWFDAAAPGGNFLAQSLNNQWFIDSDGGDAVGAADGSVGVPDYQAVGGNFGDMFWKFPGDPQP